ncbi:hypothetical protein [Agromyces larvae]|uniref:Uncharacterized protein n=1 Tax=Agromyces larvae TaxID=2929802 RepID=A0ABY4BYW7_9MICO|nr:hypothetical protein [Agromyces larvae]UOE42881.1 hypothetical protein MTO99_11855 [Agromyces larvae]
MTSSPNRLLITAWASGFGALIAGLACTLVSAFLLDGFAGGMLTGVGIVLLCAATLTFGGTLGALRPRGSSHDGIGETGAGETSTGETGARETGAAQSRRGDQTRTWWLPSRDGDR